MELANELKTLYIDTADKLKGSDRRLFMARVAGTLGYGGQSRAARELGWNRSTIRKGRGELASGQPIQDNFSARGRKPAEHHLPDLLQDIQALVEAQSQTDPTFATTRLYTRLSAAEVRTQLIKHKGYTDQELPCQDTIRVKLNDLGYKLRSVKKSRPKKKIPETDAIFDELQRRHQAAATDATVLRISFDAKATVLVGPFSRRGRSRVVVKALDHDFNPKAKLTPFGIFLPDFDEIYLYFTASRVTSDFIVDCLSAFWHEVAERFGQVRTLLLNQDNGPENHSRRTQFMKRMTEFADATGLTVELVYYPPYHSKYNPIERLWGVLEQHWNGSLLDSVETVLGFARTMRWKGQQAMVQLVERVYQTGVCLSPKAMTVLEGRFERLAGLERWFVRIEPQRQFAFG